MDFPPNVPPFPHLVRWDRSINEWIAPKPETLDRLIPVCETCDQNLILYPHKSHLFGDLWWGPIKSYGLMGDSYRSAYNQSLGLIVKPKNGPGRWVQLPHKGAIAEDIEISDNTLYLLANQSLSLAQDLGLIDELDRPNEEPLTTPILKESPYQVVVYALTLDQATEALLSEDTGIDPDAWVTILTFQSDNPVRSFVKVGDGWYFGLGVNHGQAAGRAGSLLYWTPAP